MKNKWLITVFALSIAAARAETSADVVMAQAQNLASTNLETRLAAREAIQAAGANASRPGADAERASYANAAIRFLSGSNPQAVRVWLTRMLGLFGGDESVGALTDVLGDGDAETRDAARRALQANPSSKAGEALRAALARATDPLLVRGLIDALAYRQDTGAVAVVAKRLSDPDPAIASAAALALGKIGDTKAVSELMAAKNGAAPPLRHDIENAILDARSADATSLKPLLGGDDGTIRSQALARLASAAPSSAAQELAGAIRGKDPVVAAAALRLAIDSKNPALLKAAIAAIPDLEPRLQAVAATVLGEARITEASGALEELTKSSDPAIRTAAITALGGAGRAESLPRLLDRLANGSEEEQRAAERAISVLRDASVDDRLTGALKNASGPAAIATVRALAARNPQGTAITLVALAETSDPQLKMAALDGLKQAGTVGELDPVLKMIVSSQHTGVRTKALSAAAAIASRDHDQEASLSAIRRAMGASVSPEQKAALVTLLAATPSPAALEAAVNAFANPDVEIRDAAIRTLSGWPDFSAARPLLKIAAGAGAESKYHVIAMRGVSKLLGLNATPAKERVALAGEAMATAQRPEEKRMIIAAVAGIKAPEARSMLEKLAVDPEVGTDASAALQKLKK